jgi:hypothetical protein
MSDAAGRRERQLAPSPGYTTIHDSTDVDCR